MRCAAALARIGYGNTYPYPNPVVGCVIVRHRDHDEDTNGDVVMGF